jgi:nucleotide-binding universal stress UspA family protein
MYKKILVRLDGSELAEAVLPHVCALAECMKAEIVLLRVMIVPIYDYTVFDPRLDVTLRGQVETETTMYLEQKATELRQSGFTVTTQFGEGEIAETILSIADQVQADLIAMSTHGRTGLARVVFGSVAEAVLHKARIPILLIRPSIVSE